MDIRLRRDFKFGFLIEGKIISDGKEIEILSLDKYLVKYMIKFEREVNEVKRVLKDVFEKGRNVL